MFKENSLYKLIILQLIDLVYEVCENQVRIKSGYI